MSATQSPRPVFHVEREHQALPAGALADQRRAVVEQHRQVGRRQVELHPAGLDLRQVEDVVDEREQVVARGVDVEQVLELLVVDLAEHLLGEHLREADDRVERRAQLVRHVGEELRLVLVGQLELAALGLDLVEQARVLDRDHGLVGEGLQQRQLLVAERRRRVARDLDRADAAAFPEHRREGDREVAGRLRDRAAAAPARPGAPRTSAKWTTRRSRIAIPVAVPSTGRGNVTGERALGLLARAAKARLAQHAGVVDEIDAERRRREQPLAAVEDLVEHRLRVGDRAADHLQHLGGRGLLLERLLRLVEEASVLDRDHRLVGKGADQLELASSERPGGIAKYEQCARSLRKTCLEHRRDDDRVVGDAVGHVSKCLGRIGRARHVVVVQHAALPNRSSDRRTRRPLPGSLDGELQNLDRLLGLRADCSRSQRPVVAPHVDAQARAVEQSFAAVEDLVEHRLRIGERAADHLQHLGGRRLLLECLGRLAQQANVLDRDDGLVGEGLQQVGLARRRDARIGPGDDDRADRLPVSQQGAPIIAAPVAEPRSLTVVSRIGECIFFALDAAGEDDPAAEHQRVRRVGVKAARVGDRRFRPVARRREVNEPPVVAGRRPTRGCRRVATRSRGSPRTPACTSVGDWLMTRSTSLIAVW